MRKMKKGTAVICAVILLLSLCNVCLGSTQAVDDTVLTFTSDVHHTSANMTDGSAKRLSDWLATVQQEVGEIDAVCICGDLGSPNANTNTYWSYASAVFNAIDAREVPLVCTTGNHEYQNGSFTPTKNATAMRYIRLGEGKAAENYAVFCLGAASTAQEFPQSDVNALRDYLKTVGTEKPVFILSHYPLHTFSFTEGKTTKTREFTNADQIVSLLNQYPNAFFVWGHNHSHKDPNYDQVIRDKIQIKKGQEAVAIGFTYLAAGAMTEAVDGNAYAGDVEGKGLMACISPDGSTVKLQYWDETRQPMGEPVTVTIRQPGKRIQQLGLFARQVAGIEAAPAGQEKTAADLTEMARELLAA